MLKLIIVADWVKQTLCVENGANDRMMLEQACIGIAVLQEERLETSFLMPAEWLSGISLRFYGFSRLRNG
ncbi:hypothetical protein [Desulforapulum autotrophicum]|nr:hypothetical protein [Desulforapulum autotrophicum]